MKDLNEEQEHMEAFCLTTAQTAQSVLDLLNNNIISVLEVREKAVYKSSPIETAEMFFGFIFGKVIYAISEKFQDSDNGVLAPEIREKIIYWIKSFIEVLEANEKEKKC